MHPLQDGSLLSSLIRDQLFEVLRHSEPKSIALVAATCRGLRELTNVLVPDVLRARGHPPGTSLRLAHRRESDILYEDWSDDWMSRWGIGPSAPPPGRDAYRQLGVSGPTEGAPAPFGTPELEPGCRARLVEPLPAEFEHLVGRDVVIFGPNRRRSYLLGDTVVLGPYRPEDFRLHDDIRWRPVDGVPGDIYWEVRLVHAREGDDKYDVCLAAAHNLRAHATCCAPLRGPPCAHLVVHGGWKMNSSGLHRHFDTAVRPRRISFRIRLRAACRRRAFFNVFLSSAADTWKDEPYFWAGGPYHRPNPPSLFSFLFSATRLHGVKGEFAQVWLPSGQIVRIPSNPGSLEALDDDLWHTVTLELCWGAMRLALFVDGEAVEYLGENAVNFNLHESLLDGYDEESLLTDGPPSEEEKARLREESRAGFRNVYLFTWVDEGGRDDDGEVQEEAPEVWMGEFLMEDGDEEGVVEWDAAAAALQKSDATGESGDFPFDADLADLDDFDMEPQPGMNA